MSWRHGLTPSLAWAAGSTASRRSSGAKPAGRLAKLMQEGYTATATVEPDAPFVVCRSFRTPPFSQKRSEQEQRINVGARGQVLYMEDSDAIVQIGDEVLRVKPHGFSNLRVTRGLSHVVKEDLLKEARKLVHQLTEALDACQKAITCLSEAGPPASRTGYLKPLEDILPRPHEGWQEDELPNMVKEYYPTNLHKRADCPGRVTSSARRRPSRRSCITTRRCAGGCREPLPPHLEHLPDGHGSCAAREKSMLCWSDACAERHHLALSCWPPASVRSSRLGFKR